MDSPLGRKSVLTKDSREENDSSLKHDRDSTQMNGQNQSSAPAPRPSRIPFTRYNIWVLCLAILLFAAILQNIGIAGHASLPVQGADGAAIPQQGGPVIEYTKRDTSPTNVCFRFSQQSAIVNGTLYLYGGQIATQQGQKQNTWTNALYSMDLTKTWQIAQPALTGLPQPSGPPAVAQGYLWSSHDSLYLYGGQFSWQPPVSPTPFSLWEYNIPSQSWKQHQNPKTSSGKNAQSNNDPVQRASEGAGVNVPSLGRGFYFGGHLDGWTTPGWSQSIPRLYLQSLLEFTFPGAKNNQVDALSSDKSAGTDGNYRNITQGGLQTQGGFTARADGLLVYIPGFGDQGILIALAGGTNETFTQMNSIDVYDIAQSTWYKQSTAGRFPDVRVNPCAVVAAAPDGSSYNVYMFGGQNLIPYGNQTQFSDMWILSVPSFTWIPVDQSKQSVPYGRSGHTCNIWDGQMVMVGGYTGTQLSCESPGVYVYDMSNLQWVQRYTALAPNGGGGGSSGGASDQSNPFKQQPAQIMNSKNGGGLEGSYGYQVPPAVASVIGGGSTGGATLTTPIATATAGPFATGKPITYTVTGSNGAVTTETSVPSGDRNSSSSAASGPNVGAIVAGVIAGLLFLLVCYLLFCTYLYRKQLQMYKHHVEMAQRQARGEKVSAIDGLLASNMHQEGDRRASDRLSNPFASNDSDRISQAVSGSQGRYGSHSGSGNDSAANSGSRVARRSSSSEDLLAGHEPTFVGVMLNPRRSLRVINRD